MKKVDYKLPKKILNFYYINEYRQTIVSFDVKTLINEKVKIKLNDPSINYLGKIFDSRCNIRFKFLFNKKNEHSIILTLII